MDKTIVDLAKALKENLENLGVCVDQLLDVVLQHETRLQDLEGPADLRNELAVLGRRIAGVKDQPVRESALAEFAILCHALGVEDLEGV